MKSISKVFIEDLTNHLGISIYGLAASIYEELGITEQSAQSLVYRPFNSNPQEISGKKKLQICEAAGVKLVSVSFEFEDNSGA